MRMLLLVGVGGFAGAVLRYVLGDVLNRIRTGAAFPHETLVINVLGCAALGALAGVADTRGVLGPGARAFLFIGVLGGFTTFSSFGYETFQLLRAGQTGTALLSVGLQVVLGIGGVWLGDAAVRTAWGR